MIGSLRKQGRQGNLKLVLWATLLALAGSTVLYLFQMARRGQSGTDIATVNNLGIPVLNFMRQAQAIKSQIAQVKQVYGPQADMILRYVFKDQGPEQLALEQMIQEKAAESAAATIGMRVSSEYLENKLKDQLFVRQVLGSVVPAQLLQNGTLNVNLLKTYLKHAGITEEQFEEEAKQAIARNTLTQLAQESVYIPKDALKDRYERLYAKRKFTLVSLPLEHYTKKAQAEQISDKALTDYFEAHKEQYRIPEKRTGTLWTFTPEQYGLVITEEERQDYYASHKNEFIAQPEEAEIKSVVLQDQKKAQELSQEFSKSPAQFTELAKKYALPVSTRILKRTGKQPAVEKAVFTREQNQVTPPLYTDKGYEIIAILSKKQPVYKTLEAVKESVDKKLMHETFKQAFITDGQRIISQVQDTPDILTRFIADKKAQESTVEESSTSTTVHAEKLFDREQENSYTYYYDNNKGYIVKLTKITQSSLPELQQVKDTVKKDLQATRAQEFLTADLDKLKQQQSLEQAKQVLPSTTVTIEKTDWLTPQSHEALKKLAEKKIPTEALFKLTQVNSKAQDVTPEGGFIVQLTEKEPFNQQEFSKKQDSIRKQLEHETQATVVQSFNEQLRKKACVKINTELMQQIVRE